MCIGLTALSPPPRLLPYKSKSQSLFDGRLTSHFASSPDCRCPALAFFVVGWVFSIFALRRKQCGYQRKISPIAFFFRIKWSLLVTRECHMHSESLHRILNNQAEKWIRPTHYFCFWFESKISSLLLLNIFAFFGLPFLRDPSYGVSA